MINRFLSLFILSFVIIYLFPSAGTAQKHHSERGFYNPYPGFEERNFGDFLRWSVWDRISGSKEDHPDKYNFPVEKNDGAYLQQNAAEFTVTWVGHSTLLVQMDGLNILTDPIWSKRASMVSFAGPKRHVKPGILFKDLPRIDVVIISHDHYDHLDEKTIKKLGNKPFYFVPLGIGEYLDDWGITRYQEMDWWDEVKFNSLKIICTPAQHFSGRMLLGQNRTLWAGWVIIGKNRRFYFGGDSGYFPGYKEIGEKYGPFDLAALPIGAYKPRWFMKPVHMSPREALKAFDDLKAKIFVPIHWGTFDLADEPLDDPPEVLLRLISNRELNPGNLWLLNHGETRIIKSDLE